MIAIAVIQLVINLALAVWMFRARSRGTVDIARLATDRATFSHEARAAQWEEELLRFRERARTQLSNLTRIGEEAQRILKRAQEERHNPNPSAEECELKAAIAIETEIMEPEAPVLAADQIPTLEEMDRKREALSRRPSLDLKTVLRDQLI